VRELEVVSYIYNLREDTASTIYKLEVDPVRHAAAGEPPDGAAARCRHPGSGPSDAGAALMPAAAAAFDCRPRLPRGSLCPGRLTAARR
jgi:hypothetical protein